MAVADIHSGVIGGIAARFRTCPATGLRIDLAAERLIKANAVAAVVFLAIGGTFGLLVALTRWPEVHLLSSDMFYLVLTAHGLDVLLLWIIFFEIAVLYFASAVLLNCRLATPRLAWFAFALMVIGGLLTNVTVLQGESSVMFTSYVPMQAAPNFYLGLILFAVGAHCSPVSSSFGTLVVAREERTYEGSVPLVTFGAITAAVIAVFTIASGAIILVPTWLWSLGYIDADRHVDVQAGVVGHGPLLAADQRLGPGRGLVCDRGDHGRRASRLSEKVSRTAFFLYILFLQLACAHHLLVEPGLSAEWKVFNTSYAMYLAVLGSLIHGMTVPGAIEAAQRKNGFTNGVFEWLRRAPWGNPAFAGMFLSLVMFGFLGRHFRCRHGHRADQPDHAQHALCAGTFPRHRGCRHDAGLHGAHLSGAAADLPARGDLAEACQDGSPTCLASALPASRCS